MRRATGRSLGVPLLAGILSLGSGVGVSASAQEWKEFRSARQTGELQRLDVEVHYGAGRLVIARTTLLYDVRLRYDGERFAPVRRWVEHEGSGELRVTLRSTGGGEDDPSRVDLENLELDLEDLGRLRDSTGRLDLSLSEEVPTDLRVEVGVAQSELKLGGIPLTNFEMQTGASETRLDFDRPNPVTMREFSIKVGAASLRATRLGNAGFERFLFKGGIGDVVLDFTGEWARSAEASIGIGLGSLRLRFPRDLGVRIDRTSFLSTFDADELTKVAGGYQTANWETAEARLDIDLDAALGAVTVEIVP